MLEKLAGRLIWERTGSGIRVEISARAGWMLAFLCLWLALFGGIGGALEFKAFNEGDPSTFMLIWGLAWLVGVGVGAGLLIWSLGGRTMLLLNQTEMTIQHRVMGFEWDKRTYATSQVCNLRYVPSFKSSGWSGSNYEQTYHQSQIRFEAEDKTRSFASGLSDIEAFALIDKMLEIYNFPKDRALAYIGRP
jgi:hypothetical protein